MDKKISQLTAASTPLLGTESLPLVQSGVTKKATVQDVLGYVVNDSTNSVLKTVYSASDIGLKLDFTNFEFYLGGVEDQYNVKVSLTGVDIGDIFYANNGNQINLTNDIIKTQHSSNDIGLKLDFLNNLYIFGESTDLTSGYVKGFFTTAGVNPQSIIGDSDSGNPGNGVSLQVLDFTQLINTTYQFNEIGLKLDFANSLYYFGDFNNIQDLIYCKADIGNGFFDIVSAQYVNFRAEGANVQIGDIDNFDNGTRFGVDDLNQKLTASANLLSNTSSGNSGQHIKIKVGGTDYKIALLNP